MATRSVSCGTGTRRLRFKVKPGDPRAATPFADAVLSDFVLDEIITNPIDNSYLKHLLLLIIYPDIPILRALESVDLREAQRNRSLLIRPPEYLKNAVDARTLAMCGNPEALLKHSPPISRTSRSASRRIRHGPLSMCPRHSACRSIKQSSLRSQVEISIPPSRHATSLICACRSTRSR